MIDAGQIEAARKNRGSLTPARPHIADRLLSHKSQAILDGDPAPRKLCVAIQHVYLRHRGGLLSGAELINRAQAHVVMQVSIVLGISSQEANLDRMIHRPGLGSIASAYHPCRAADAGRATASCAPGVGFGLLPTRKPIGESFNKFPPAPFHNCPVSSDVKG